MRRIPDLAPRHPRRRSAPETRIEAGDVVVVLGESDALEAAEIRMLQGTK